MKKLALALLAVAALATVTAAAAAAGQGSGYHGIGRFDRSGVIERLAGSGSGFRTDSATAGGAIAGHPLSGGNFSASLQPDWSNAVSKWPGRSCAPTTGTLSLSGADSSNTLTSSVHGVTCTVPSNSRDIAAVFFGKTRVTNATGNVSNVTGYGRVVLYEKTDGTVKGLSIFGGAKRGVEHQPETFHRR